MVTSRPREPRVSPSSRACSSSCSRGRWGERAGGERRMAAREGGGKGSQQGGISIGHSRRETRARAPRVRLKANPAAMDRTRPPLEHELEHALGLALEPPMMKDVTNLQCPRQPPASDFGFLAARPRSEVGPLSLALSPLPRGEGMEGGGGARLSFVGSGRPRARSPSSTSSALPSRFRYSKLPHRHRSDPTRRTVAERT